ncbi:hypothetical protein EGW08_012315 [Elysia chlorotica]|uniref:Glycosylphosphatidylinositol anchor biosynthesis protein 11 n=1 Tax=Elysia chlorotica TaxID=188477 RepID=A0A3S1BBY6_ELYCH|nr:hypothetical protein EGW08_012315 [Elysia chlorotica]
MKAQEKFIVTISVVCFLSAVSIGGLTSILVLNDGVLSIVKNTLAAMKLSIGAVCSQCLFIWLLNWRCKPLDSSNKNQTKVSSQAFTILKCLGILFVAPFIFHGVAILFGAPFFESSAQTYHFAVLLTAQVFLPFCLFLGLDLDAWLRVFAYNSSEWNDPLELLVYYTSTCSLLGGWLGAVPIPLDWDRPWQVWPISCVIGALLGYSVGLLLSSIVIPRQYRARHKFKFF